MKDKEAAEYVARYIRSAYEVEAKATEYRAWGEPEPIWVVLVWIDDDVLLPAAMHGVSIWRAPVR